VVLYLRKQKVITLGIGPGNKKGEVASPEPILAEWFVHHSGNEVLHFDSM
jgi:hypothetical protein